MIKELKIINNWLVTRDKILNWKRISLQLNESSAFKNNAVVYRNSPKGRPFPFSDCYGLFYYILDPLKLNFNMESTVFCVRSIKLKSVNTENCENIKNCWCFAYDGAQKNVYLAQKNLLDFLKMSENWSVIKKKTLFLWHVVHWFIKLLHIESLLCGHMV